ncbi:lipocalin-like domain-containing protein [Halomonas vilamensis]|uniref:Lipocalin-like domain-containing protein n=1 Tax=Vreelandella vilamensis TaxID=531309 RepID=A0ABU1GZS3_9GAMM|nr:lipocalin-like domain-containing protein [Halomonas vilamensis]MDR5897562.1 lipocalin-like domain-containing protein [Halomonas vilamensis]
MSRQRRQILLITLGCLALMGCQEAPPTAEPQGFAGLGQDAAAFAQADASSPLRFPQDHGPHPDYRIEWWYLTANLEDDQGEPLGLQWTLFRQALTPPDERPAPSPWAVDQVWMAHLGVSQGETHVAAERFARSHSEQANGQAGVKAAPFQAWIDDWTLESPADANFQTFSLNAHSGEGNERFGYELTLSAQGPLVWHGENGFNAKTVEGQGSHYYSQPYLQISGRVTLNGKTRDVSGQGWLDREWSSQLLTPEQTGWDWFSLHLADGRKLMTYRLRGGGHGGDDYVFAHLLSADGHTELIGPDSVTLTSLATQAVAGRDIPTRWSLTLPDADMQLVVEARHPNRWMPTSVPYWEGDVVVRQAETQENIGVGYLEMTGY